MNSMTGYGRAEGLYQSLSLTVEVSSVNKKNLEIFVALPRDLQALERGVQDLVRERFQRGKFSIYIQIKPVGGSEGARWDIQSVRSAIEELRNLAEQTGTPFDLSADALVRLVQMVGNDVNFPATEDLEQALKPILEQALNELSQMRAKEGEAMQADLLNRADVLAGYVSTVQKLAQNTVPNYREALLERLKQAKLELDLCDDRVLREIALFADRSDTSEEMTRLNSHLEQLRTFCNSTEPIGRKMDFLCQELNREVNTIGSKANHLEITRHVLEMKNEVERIREQVQNIE